MRRLRRIHALLGVFFAPSIVFFALTGVMQVCEVQAKRDGYDPPQWALHVMEVHKHQKWELRKRPPAPTPEATPQAPQPSQRPQPPEPEMKPGQAALKFFAVMMGLGLAITALLGIWMAWQVPRDRKLVAGLIIAGSLLPAAFLAF